MRGRRGWWLGGEICPWLEVTVYVGMEGRAQCYVNWKIISPTARSLSPALHLRPDGQEMLDYLSRDRRGGGGRLGVSISWILIIEALLISQLGQRRDSVRVSQSATRI